MDAYAVRPGRASAQYRQDSTPLGRSSDPRRSKTSVKPSAMQEIGISINPGSGKALENMVFGRAALYTTR